MSWYTANNFGIMYSWKSIGQNLFPNLIYIFPKSFMIFCQELQDPKRNYENLKPRIPRMSSWKKLHILDLNTGPLHVWQVLCHWTIKADTNLSYIPILVPFRTNKDSFLPVTFTFLADLFPQLGSWHEQLFWKIYVSCFGGPMSKYLELWQRSWVRILGVTFNFFSCWHPWETRFKSGFHSSFWDFLCGIYNWGMAISFWNHVIQISIRQVHFQDMYSQLWIVKFFNENIYFL